MNIIVFKSFYEDIKRRQFFGLLIMLVICGFVFYGCGSTRIRWLDYESTQEVAAGIDALSTKDFKYVDWAFWGYPARQYIMLSVSTLILGANTFSVHFAFDFIFAISALIMYCGLKEYFKSKTSNNSLAAGTIVMAVFTSPLIAVYTRISEQVLLPPSFTMMAIGWFFLYFSKKDLSKTNVFWILGLGFCGAMMGAMYTPAFASCCLLIAVLTLYTFKLTQSFAKSFKISGGNSETSGAEKKQLLAKIALNISVVLYVSIPLVSFVMMIMKGFDSLKSNKTAMDFVVKSTIGLIKEDPYGLFRLFTPVVLAYMALALAGLFKKIDMQIVIWVIAAVLSALLMKGVNYDSYTSIQRGMIVVPVLITFMGIRYIEAVSIIKSKLKRWVIHTLAGIYILLIFTLNFIKPIFPPNFSQSGGKYLTYLSQEIANIV
ncbi:MAG: hypothetical protein LBQ68_09700, partial [Clostridiales bacterium]|nr:hypothetical protein [Clostridiales bacterium]